MAGSSCLTRTPPTCMCCHSTVNREWPGRWRSFTDASFIDRQTAQLRQESYLHVLIQTLFIVLTTLLIIRWSILRPIARTAKWIRDLRDGKRVPRPSLAEGDLFKPLAQEVTHLAKSLEAARAAAEEEARLRETAESLWTPERLVSTSAASWATGRSSSSPTANPTCTSIEARQWRLWSRPVAWSRHSNPFCELAREPGWRTVRETPTAKPWTSGIACGSRPTIPNTR